MKRIQSHVHTVPTIGIHQKAITAELGTRSLNKSFVNDFNAFNFALEKSLPNFLDIYVTDNHILWASVARTDGEMIIAGHSTHNESLVLLTKQLGTTKTHVGIDLLTSYPSIDKSTPECRPFDIDFVLQPSDDVLLDGTSIHTFTLRGMYINLRNEKIYFSEISVDHTISIVSRPNGRQRIEPYTRQYNQIKVQVIK